MSQERLKYQPDMYVVVNKKHLGDLLNSLYPTKNSAASDFNRSLVNLNKFLPENKYYICNQDEPYAKDVIEIILTNGKYIENLKLIAVEFEEAQKHINCYFDECINGLNNKREENLSTREKICIDATQDYLKSMQKYINDKVFEKSNN